MTVFADFAIGRDLHPSPATRGSEEPLRRDSDERRIRSHYSTAAGDVKA
jgi:hypothetical protein